jgi:trehalose/maltose hydrolase-like predicted phosphorylase
VNHWLWVDDGFEPEAEGRREALCVLGNGYLGSRGATPESTADGVHYPGTYLAGCYNRLESHVAGHVVEHEDLVNAPNWLPVTFRIEGGAWFDPAAVELHSYRQELDMRRGVLTRRLRYTDDAGRTSRMTQRRLVSMADPHLAALETTIEPENWDGIVQVRVSLDGQVTNAGVERYRDLAHTHLTSVDQGCDKHDRIWLCVETVTSATRIAEAARVTVEGADEVGERTVEHRPGWIGMDITVDARRGVPVTVEKVVAIYTSNDRAISDCLTAARDRADDADHFDTLLAAHMGEWSWLWRACRITVPGESQRVLNLHLFHLLQTLSKHTTELDVGVPARGLHGEAYRGHIFWDELFVFPYLSTIFPHIAEALLLYRWRRLPAARRAARVAGYRGAMYPWQSGSDGREESPRFHLNPVSGRWIPDNSSLQRHVGLAVAHNVWQYYRATGDLSFLIHHGAEMLVEIARFWCSLATYNRSRDRYEITGVMGPDEYHDAYPDADRPGLANNAYTNIMVAWVVRAALEALATLPEHRRHELIERLALDRTELDHFDDVSRRLVVIFHDDGVISQFEGYADLAEFDWDAYREKYGNIRRLDRILEAEGDTPNRYKVSKQADVLMLLFLLGEHELTATLGRLGYRLDGDAIDRTVAYYHARTAHGSTLSAVVHAWALARRSGRESWRHLREALDADVGDEYDGTTREGIHLGAMAGTVDLLTRCFLGLEMRGETLRLNPTLPDELESLELELNYRGHSGVTVSCDGHTARIALRESDAAPVSVAIADQAKVLSPGESWQLSCPRAP